jgi:mutator protein MutT
VIDIVNGLLIQEGTVLLVRRSPQRKAYPDMWSFPGGHLEQAETLSAALVRELREEIGVFPTAYTPLGTIDDPNTRQNKPITYHMYVVTEWQGGKPVLRGDEHTELGWFRPGDAILLPDLAMDEYRQLLRNLP